MNKHKYDLESEINKTIIETQDMRVNKLCNYLESEINKPEIKNPMGFIYVRGMIVGWIVGIGIFAVVAILLALK
ncbi:MAG: hypothetical protein JNL74_04085 [Fibrobacteres bacterium]|nr:hypothetical protein [Fibrobacterota bacterium]